MDHYTRVLEIGKVSQMEKEFGSMEVYPTGIDIIKY